MTADPFQTPDALRFRADLREWLARELPPAWGTDDFDSPPDEAAEVAWLRAWQRRLHDGGWAGLSWPTVYGGGGATVIEQVIFAEERDRARAPIDIGIVGTQMVGPMLMAHGTDAQKARYLPRILTGEELWCQGFSEPEAGSDLAALRTRARPVEGGWQIDGQKVWTSRAQYAEQMILLARTDPDAPAHRGITAFIVPLDAKSLVIRPIRQINGSTEFCEVFCEGVVVPADAVVGEVDAGWKVAISTLSFERLATTRAFEMRRLVCDLIAAHPTLAVHDGASAWTPLHDEVTRHVLDAHAAGLAFQRLVAAIAVRGDIGADASATKLATTELGQRIVASALSTLPGAAATGPVHPRIGGPVSWSLEFTNGVKNTIAAGTSQIQRNIIGERVLGLPRPGATRPPLGATDGDGPRPFRDPTLPEEQEEFLATLRRALNRVLPTSAVIASAEDAAAFDGTAAWAALVDLGCAGIGVDEASGGLSLLGLAVGEAGHALAPGALLGHAVALRLLVRATAPASGLVEEMAGSGGRATVGDLGPNASGTLAVDAAGRVSGRVDDVLEPSGATQLVAWADHAGRRALVTIDLNQAGVTTIDVPSFDQSRRFGSVAVDPGANVVGEVVAVGEQADRARRAAALDTAVLVASDALGSARRTLDDAVAYACERRQFGELIGAFQAVKHLLVDAHVRLEGTRAAVQQAAANLDEGGHGPFVVHAAKALANEAHASAAATAIQVFGGIGFTREITAHLHLKRARVNEHLAGGTAHHRRAASQHLDSVAFAWSTAGEPSRSPSPLDAPH